MNEEERAQLQASIAFKKAQTVVAREIAAEIDGYTERGEVAPAELMARARLLASMDSCLS